MERQTVFITGSSGFIGTNLTQYFLKLGWAVIALDTKEPRELYQGYRCADYPAAEEGNYDLIRVKGDVRDGLLLREIFWYPIDYVIHLAALSTLQLGAEDSRETMSVNAGGTETLLRAAAEYGKLKGFLYASTDKVYGILRGEAYRETDKLLPVNSPYDCSKAEADRLVREWSEKYGVPGIVLRFCNIYGRYDLQATRVVPGTIRALLEGRNCTLRMYRDADGVSRNFQRDFLYVDDLCRTIGKIIGQLNGQGREFQKWGEAFNLGARRCYPVDEVIGIIQGILGSSRPPEIGLAESLAEIPRQRMDYTKAAETFGFAPVTSLEDGLTETVAWWKEYMRGFI